MLRYLVIRLLQGILVLFLISILTFGLLKAAPGSPVDLLVGTARVTQEARDNLTAKWGLDRPVHEQYLTWIGNVLQGDFGESISRSGTPVTQVIAEAIPYTLALNVMAITLAIAIAIPLGILAAYRRNSVLDYVTTATSTLGVAVPNYWIGILGIILFASILGWLPTYGASNGWRSYVLPVAVLAFEEMAALIRVTRGATLEALSSDHVQTARAKGLREKVVMTRHVVRNAMLPIVTVLGYRIAFILSGTIVIETVFSFPGIGRLFSNSLFSLDYQVVQALVLLLATIVVIGNLLTDLTYALIDPRIRIS
ncbi:MAG TPA: ABC transporter permease [Thermomicrobiales bacterium]|jgi:peptide/nickel transport system permease protein|nr:ABC transporter permease [Thermomicrobiales bacterium]